MKRVHRTYELVATKERALGGWSDVYYHAVRRRDGYMLFDGFGGFANAREALDYMRGVIDILIDQHRGNVERLDDSIDAWFVNREAKVVAA